MAWPNIFFPTTKPSACPLFHINNYISYHSVISTVSYPWAGVRTHIPQVEAYVHGCVRYAMWVAAYPIWVCIWSVGPLTWYRAPNRVWNIALRHLGGAEEKIKVNKIPTQGSLYSIILYALKLRNPTNPLHSDPSSSASRSLQGLPLIHPQAPKEPTTTALPAGTRPPRQDTPKPSEL